MINGRDIKAKRKALKWSAAKLAMALNVKEDNIYKWEKGTRISDPEQYMRVENWLKSGKLENVPHETSNHSDSNGHFSEAIKDKHIALLHRDNARLEQELEVSLNNIAEDIIVISGMNKAALEILLILASEKKSVYNKCFEVLKKHGLEGIFP